MASSQRAHAHHMHVCVHRLLGYLRRSLQGRGSITQPHPLEPVAALTLKRGPMSTSKPMSVKPVAMILYPLSWPSSPTLATRRRGRRPSRPSKACRPQPRHHPRQRQPLPYRCRWCVPHLPGTWQWPAACPRWPRTTLHRLHSPCQPRQHGGQTPSPVHTRSPPLCTVLGQQPLTAPRGCHCPGSQLHTQ